jgi:hypothetical protein
VAELVLELSRLKARMFRPHWIVLEEAQFFLPIHGNSVSTPLLPMLTGGGWAFVSYRPDRLASQVLASLDQCLLTRSSEPEALQTVRRWLNGIDESPANIPQGYAWSSSQGLVRLRSGGRRVPHIRHLYKYFDTPLPPHKRFAFRDEQSFLGVEAASLLEFLQCLSDLPIESLSYHQARGDFAAWAEGALGDGILATQLRKLAHRSLEGQALRAALRHCVASHYTDLHAAR